MILAALLLAAAAAAPAPEAAAHRQAIEAWRAKRLANLKREDGWLSLVGLFWLKEGENAFGSDPSGRIIFPAGTAPGMLGSIRLSKDKASVRVEPGAALTNDGKPVVAMDLKSDAEEGGPTVLKHGRISFFLIKRGSRLGVRVKDSRNPALLSFQGIETFPVDAKWRFDAKFDSYGPGKTIRVPNILGSVDDEPSPGAVVFEVGGRSYRIDAVKETGSEELFLIFGDQTNGEVTYGGGRFLYAAPPDKEGRVVVDFNKAYNPPCVFTPYATCPLPPLQNRLSIRVEAGEKTYGHH